MLQISQLPNGLRVVVDPMPSLETAAIGVWANAGSVDETLAEHGLAHLLEHMAFKGTASRTARQIAEEIEAVGGYLNAATSHQRTGYYARVLKDNVDLGLDLLADILRRPVFDEGEFEKEKEVVIQEIGEAADLPDDVVFENLQAISWDGCSLARPILGTPASVRAHSVDGLRAFMARLYQPSRMVVAAAGKVDAERFIKGVEAAFGDLSDKPGGGGRTAPRFCGGRRHDGRAIEQSHVAVAFEGVASSHPDFFASRVFAEAWGGGMSSRLFQRVREERGLAYSVYAFSDSYDQCGLVGAYAGADHEEIPEIVGAFRSELGDMAENAQEDEINRARAMLRASLMMALESPSARIENAAGQIFRSGAVLSAAEISERLDAVSVEDVRRCARRALEGERALSLVGPAAVDAAAKALTD
ncbi:MAG: pitrilysin family protein [Pseudomonadota bacterium]